MTIDCDVHPAVPGLKSLFPYLDSYWRESFVERGVPGFEPNTYPPNVPLSQRPDWKAAKAAGDVTSLAREVLDKPGNGTAILNCLYGAELPFSEDMGRAVARAVNDWIRAEWLDRDPRLRASIVIPTQNIDFAVEEIERCAPDRRFVAIKVMAMQESPLGKRRWWPIYAVAERYGLPVTIHPGSTYRHATTSLGWPSSYTEEYTAYSQVYQSQLASLICEGVFQKFPDLKVVLLESGVAWLPPFLWRITKLWRGLRSEVPWVDRPAGEIIRDNVRLTVTPFDAPDDPDVVARLVDHLRSDAILLYASDFPHWHHDGEDAMPRHMPAGLAHKIRTENALATYARLREETP